MGRLFFLAWFCYMSAHAAERIVFNHCMDRIMPITMDERGATKLLGCVNESALWDRLWKHL